jgi:hypothetical protein
MAVWISYACYRPCCIFKQQRQYYVYLLSEVFLKVETYGWLSNGKLVAPKEDNIHIRYSHSNAF